VMNPMSDRNEDGARSAEFRPATLNRELPIGVFDSGVGGLTVLRALRRALPEERFVYLGDTARLPYGTKSAESVLHYSLQAAQFLVAYGVKHLVLACNTAASVAVSELRRRLHPLPVVGVIEPGAAAACAASRSGAIGVIATEATVRGGSYQRAIARLRPDAVVSARACSLFVALAEEGWTTGPIVEATAHRYLDDLFREHPAIDTLLLGCTHFPVLAQALRSVAGPRVAIVDSADTTAARLREEIERLDMRRSAAPHERLVLLATDGPERFARVGSLFLGEPLAAEQVDLVHPGGQ
jgi:glutamate racemase